MSESIKELTMQFRGRCKGIGGTSGKAHRTIDANVSLRDGRILHVLKKANRFRLFLIGEGSGVEIGVVTLAQLQQASQSGQISVDGRKLVIPNSRKQFARILA